MRFDVEPIEPRGADHVVVDVTGEVDLSIRDRLTEALERAVARGTAAVVADLSGVSFFCAAGVNVLEDTADALVAGGRQLHLVCPRTSAALRVLTLLALESAWPVHPTRADAVRAISGASV